MASNNNQTFSLRFVLEKNKLNGTNFIDWSRNLRIVLKQEKKLEVLEHPLSNEPARNATNAQREAFDKRKNNSNDVTVGFLMQLISLINGGRQEKHTRIEHV